MCFKDFPPSTSKVLFCEMFLHRDIRHSRDFYGISVSCESVGQSSVIPFLYFDDSFDWKNTNIFCEQKRLFLFSRVFSFPYYHCAHKILSYNRKSTHSALKLTQAIVSLGNLSTDIALLGDRNHHYFEAGSSRSSHSKMSGLNVVGSSLKYKNILVVIKQTAFEEYSQVRLSYRSGSFVTRDFDIIIILNYVMDS